MPKRLFDFFFAVMGFFFLWPLFLLSALWIKVDSAGPIFFLQERIGQGGRPFKIFKFRTMVHKSQGSSVTVSGDQRITSCGKYLRKFKLDELPQLLNIIKGEMSFVGPRPEVNQYVSLYTEEQRKVLHYLPGITDPASLKYRNESEVLSEQQDPQTYYVNVIMPDKIKLNLAYVRRATLLSDIKLILETVMVSLKGR